MSDASREVLPESHTFPVTTKDGHMIDLGPLANELLTARRNQMQDAELDTPMNPGKLVRAGFEMGVYAAVRSIGGRDARDAFREHCDQMWRAGST